MRHQATVTALLAYATFIAFKCPCTKTLSCHLPHFYLSTGAAIALVTYENGFL